MHNNLLRRFASALVLFFMCIIAVAQNVTVSGTVKDTQGQPIIGAAIVVQGTTHGTVSDFDGNYSLSGVPSNATIQVAFIGYTTVSQPVGGRTKIDFVLKDEFAELEEVQVVAYGAQKKVTVTGAIASVDGSELAKTPTGSVSNMLSGQMAGLTTVQYSGEPGADGADIFVRGKATWVDASPLVQVDGVERDFNDIDPNEIESITILKDASATAVFGVRGANGVVLVTTKRGTEGKAKINVTTSYSLLMPTKTIEQASSYDYANFYNGITRNDYEGVAEYMDAEGNFDTSKYSFSPDVIQKFKDHSDPYRFPDVDWIDMCLKKATLQTQHNLNVSGGADKIKYFISTGFYTQGGLFKTFDLPYDCSYEYKRFNYRANLDIAVTPTTTLLLGIGGNHNTSWKPYTGQGSSGMLRNMYAATPFSGAGIVDGKLILSTSDGYEDGLRLPFVGGNGIQQYYGVGFYNDTNNKLNVDLELKQKLDMLTQGLSFRIKGAYNSDFTSYNRATYSVPVYTPWLVNGELSFRKGGAQGQLAYQNQTPSKGRNWYMEVALNYDRTFADSHHITALALYNQSKTYYPRTYPEIPQGYVGLVGRLTYDFQSRYMAEFNIGYNGSENFAEDKRFGVFPAGSVGWNISQEKFWEPIKYYVSYFKIRYTIGQVGNDKIGGSRFMYTPDPYVTNNTTAPNRGGYAAIFGDDDGIGTSHPGTYEKSKNNQDVTWEVSTKQNFGVDLYFFEDALKCTFDYYVDKRRDILLQNGTAPLVLGFQTPYANLGSVDSWGWEATVKWNKRVNEDWLWNLGVNLMYNQNEIIDRREAVQEYDYQYTKGYRIGKRSQQEFFEFYELPGKDGKGGTAERYKAKYGVEMPTQFAGSDLKPGDCVYVDQNGDGVIDANDATHNLGYTDDPEYMIGVNGGFTWKNLSFSMLWSGAWNVSRSISGAFQQPFWAQDGSDQGGLLKYHVNHTWTPENPSQDAWYPRATFTRKSNNYIGSDLWEKNSAYFRLKNVMLSYNFKFPFMEKIKMNTFQFAITGYNLITFTPYEFGDPESKASNAPSYPLNRTITASLKLGF